jgi:isoaspartyl peptidase/L-asparaginase-like protein (Ntn-hydrolase superfamily)
VERARDAGWSEIGRGALVAAMAAVRLMEDEPLLNAGIGACLNADGVVELDAGVMEGAELRAGGVAGLKDVRHPIDLALEVMRDGRRWSITFRPRAWRRDVRALDLHHRPQAAAAPARS